MFRIIISLLLLATASWAELAANFNMKGVTGKVTFTQAAAGQDVTITLNLANTIAGDYMLALHEYRVNFDQVDPCSSTGNVRKNLGTAAVTSGQGTLVVSGMDLSGVSSIEGRSLLFQGSQMTVCANIEASREEYITAFAKMPAGLGGTVVFRQQENSAGSDTMIYTNLFFVGTARPSPLKWRIYSGNVKMDTVATTDVADRCGSTIGSLYNPTQSSGAGCSTTNHASCAVGSLSSKHNDIPVSNTNPSRNFFIDLSLPLSGANSIIGKTLVFLNGDAVFACANIVEYPRTSAQAQFSEKGVSGTVAFSQRSPLDVATITVNISKTEDNVSLYKIAQWPTPQRMTKSEAVCDMKKVGEIFNPFSIDSGAQGYPAAATTTPDLYQVGDLSGKFGGLSTSNQISQTFTDTNIQLFGRNSVVGRSLVFYNKQNERYFCSTIRSTAELTTAVAKFTYPVIGYIILQQPKDMWYADTQIYVELDYGTTTTRTTMHNWHVHEKPTGNDTMTDSGRCVSVAGHYNPYGVDLGGDYSTQCNPSNPLRCEVGDLSKKHVKVDIRTASGGKTKYFFTDTQLPLRGPLGVIGKSITIHGENSAGARLSCTNILEQMTRVVRVNSWSAASGQSTPSGSITFTQHCTDLWACVSRMDLELSNLGDVSGYHVHQYPTTLDTGATDTCQNADVGGHFNPFDGPPVGPASGTNDMYEVGDLSGKFGGLTAGSVTQETDDMNLPLLSPLSISLRSVVIHKVGGARWACGNVMDTSGTLVQAKAIFTGDYEGYVLLSQYRYSDGTKSPTAILVDLKNKDGTTTTGHNWHVHETRRAKGDTSCQSCQGHYNPYMVNMNAAGYQECGLGNPLRCEVGDQSSKLGRYDIGSGKAFFTDVNLDIEGPISAAKRSFVFHAANGEGARIACANIIPFGPSVKSYEYKFPRVEYANSLELETTIAMALSEPERDILAVEKTVESRCITVTLYFLGPHKDRIYNEFADLLRSGNHNILGKFQPSNDCTTSSAGLAQISVFTMLMSILLVIFGQKF